MNNERPTFGATPPEPLKEKKDVRHSIGSIWEKTSKDNQTKYMTLNLKLSKELLQQLLAQDEAQLNLVAFQNKYKEDGKSPDFKVYQEIENKG